MAEEKNEATPAPAESAPVTPPTPQQAAAVAPKKKSNAGVIILVVVLVLVILGGGISYGIYRFVKNRVTTAITDVANTAGVSTDVSNAGKDLNDYSAVKDITPTDSIAKTTDTTVKPILANLFGGAKLTLWSSVSDGGTLTYTTKNSITSADYSKLESALIDAGYTKDSNYNSSDSFIVYLSKGNTSLTVMTSTSSATQVSVVVSQSSSDTSSSE